MYTPDKESTAKTVHKIMVVYSEKEHKYLKADLNTVFDRLLSICLNNITTFHKKFKTKNKPIQPHQVYCDRAHAELVDGFKRVLTSSINHTITQGGVFMFKNDTSNMLCIYSVFTVFSCGAHE